MQQITLYQLNKLIQNTLEQNLDTSYWVVAEIGELRVNQKGHCYLELVEKEHDRLIAKLRGNIWAYDFYNINSLFRSVTGQPLKTGMKILARVVVQFHELYGLSLHIKDLDPNFTLGERARNRQQVIERLTREGVLQQNKKLPLPLVPQKIAVISSRTAAGYGDFMDQLMGNPQGYAFDVKLFETVMQGEEAVNSAIRAIKIIGAAHEQFDLVALIRGGGSQVDLDCFDSYQLALEITRCPLPVITGIGHQRDDTIADMVAHSKMKTPTAVAEFLINGMDAFEQQLNFLYDRIRDMVSKQLNDQQNRLFNMFKNLDHSAKIVISGKKHRIDLLNQRLGSAAGGALKTCHQNLKHFHDRLQKVPPRIISNEQQKLQIANTKFNLADPANILKRGYSITYLNGKVVKQDTEIGVGDEIETRVPAKRIKSNITEISNE